MEEKLEYVKECLTNTLSDVKEKAVEVVKEKQEIDDKLESVQFSIFTTQSQLDDKEKMEAPYEIKFMYVYIKGGLALSIHDSLIIAGYLKPLSLWHLLRQRM